MENNDRSYDLEFTVDSKLNEIEIIENSKRINEESIEILNTGAKKEYLFNGSVIESQYFYIMLSLFVSNYKLSDACAKDLLKLFSIVLPQPNSIKRNIDKLRFDKYNEQEPQTSITEIVCEKCWNIKIDYGPCLNESCSLFNKEPCSGELFFF